MGTALVLVVTGCQAGPSKPAPAVASATAATPGTNEAPDGALPAPAAAPAPAALPTATPAPSPGEPASSPGEPSSGAAEPAAPSAVTATPPARPPVPEHLRAFWREFRSALFGSDWKSIEGMTQFPFEHRGSLDSDPVNMIGRKELRKILKDVLEWEAGCPPNYRETISELLQRTEEPPPDATEDSFRVCDFEFMRTDGKWRFYAMY